jgi:hypothetical protein
MPAPIGKPASKGTGPEQYSIRLPIWLAGNIRFQEVELLRIDESIAFSVEGHRAEIERRETSLTALHSP